MSYRTAKWATAAGAAAILLFSSGCARIQDVDSMQAEIDALKGELAAAQSEAANARAEAAGALEAAGAASARAGNALRTANTAAEGSADNAEKLDRMFEKVMMK